MTHAIDSALLSYQAPPARVGVPDLPSWVVPRPQVIDRLDLGASGLVTLVTGATGWGKTLAVASWASGAEVPGGLIWLDLAGTDGDPDLFWKLMREGLLEAGERHFAPVPDVGCHERQRQQVLALLGRTLRRSGPWVVVLDDFPTGTSGGLARDLEVVTKHAQRGMRLVVISHGEPAIEVSRHHVAGELTRISASDLAMDAPVIAQVLVRHGVEASELTAMAVHRHTAGWPCGVRLAALALRDAPTFEAAMEVADRAAVAYLASEVLAKSPPRLRDLIVRTSMVEFVSPDLARAVLGSADGDVLDLAVADDAFIAVGDDNSFRCHPLLRAAALGELAREPREVGQEARRCAAQWYLDQGDASTGLGLAMAAEDWPWVARALVESYAVPRILTGSAGEVVESALAIAAVRAAEPLLEAALSLRQGGVDAADAVLARATKVSPTGSGSVAARISAAFVALAVARLRGDTTTGLCLAPQVRSLMSQVPGRRDELSTILDAHLGALELCRGATHRAALMLKRGATRTSVHHDTSSRQDCQGQLALLQAYQGDLRLAERQASPTLGTAGELPGPGVSHAHLAMAWVHLERREPVPARQHLDRAADAGLDELEPWFVALRLVAESRLLTVTGHPEAALRLLIPAMRAAVPEPESKWTADLLTIASAETLLVSGEPRLALEMVTPVPLTMPVEGGILAASALFELGDLADAKAALAPVAGDLSTVPLGYQVGCWLLEARLADQSGSVERARVLADRALRAAGAETLRRPFDTGSAWLSALVDGDPRLRRAHGGFLVGLGASTPGRTGRRADVSRPAPLVIEALTVREAQVLGLLAEMCSTDEIARELFLSVNTVKTYVRGILRKLSVNRRVDAVRRGRELGLC